MKSSDRNKDRRSPNSQDAFTLIELLVVLAIIATLLTIATPRYFGSLENSKEVALRKTLGVIREAIDQHLTDTGRNPNSLDELVTLRYLRTIPIDPITDRTDSWQIVTMGANATGLADVRSGATGTGRDGTPYATW